MAEPEQLDEWKMRARNWFETLCTQVHDTFETIEKSATSSIIKCPAGRFLHKDWKRKGGGGGVMSTMSGRVFEKVGAHISTVHGNLSPEMCKKIPGTEEDPSFWASGISIISHMWNPHIPTIHMNTRMLVTNKYWFGGGADLTPMLKTRRCQEDPDNIDFHAAMQATCEAHAVADYAVYKKWCDDYFFLPHRGEPRGIGGIFYDNLNSGNWEKDFAFTQELGRTFLSIYSSLIERNMEYKWNEEEKNEQLIQRGRYVEFNLLYDRGTLFGLKTGGNIDSIFSSMPPNVKWP
ncbi:MAG: oxygen-dependent coproporphyrinogen oxidase [Alphaproteobacteria bacterium]|nr:oxygen-dependent coproporphyrinogen oxidase [Alphaproteobacteria bacterium]